MSIAPLILVLANDELLRQIEKPSAQSERNNLVDLIGRHDCVHVFVMISATINILFFFDMLTRNSGHVLNLLYYSQHCYFTLNQLMS